MERGWDRGVTVPRNATLLCILLAHVVTIICGHWPIGGHAPFFSLNTPLAAGFCAC